MPPRVEYSEQGFWNNLKSFGPILLPILIPMFGFMIWFIRNDSNTQFNLKTLIDTQAKIELRLENAESKYLLEHDSVIELRGNLALLQANVDKLSSDLTQGYVRGQKRDADIQSLQSDTVSVKQVLSGVQTSITQQNSLINQLNDRVNGFIENFYKEDRDRDRERTVSPRS